MLSSLRYKRRQRTRTGNCFQFKMQVPFLTLLLIAIIFEGLQQDSTVAVPTKHVKSVGECFLACYKTFERCTHECPFASIITSYQYNICKQRLERCNERCVKRFGVTEEKGQ
ncbi:hypothetical protein LSAT2_001516 [Lamellibrachia satsuma]|nr:hypothetical protein LSAT2_001516 [Lamellibrachia satsuma]